MQKKTFKTNDLTQDVFKIQLILVVYMFKLSMVCHFLLSPNIKKCPLGFNYQHVQITHGRCN